MTDMPFISTYRSYPKDHRRDVGFAHEYGRCPTLGQLISFPVVSGYAPTVYTIIEIVQTSPVRTVVLLDRPLEQYVPANTNVVVMDYAGPPLVLLPDDIVLESRPLRQPTVDFQLHRVTNTGRTNPDTLKVTLTSIPSGLRVSTPYTAEYVHDRLAKGRPSEDWYVDEYPGWQLVGFYHPNGDYESLV